MATTVIIDTGKSRTSTARSTDYAIYSVSGEQHTAKIIDIVHTSKSISTDYAITTVKDIVHSSSVKSILPFYISFATIGIPGYGPNNVPPIGIAIVGVNNYIL